METYKIIIEYDGTRYGGFRKSKRGGAATIQDKIEAVLNRMEQGQSFTLTAAVNTEAGIHSMGQTISYKTEQHFREQDIKDYMNQYLPQDIVVREVKQERVGFHAEFAMSALLYEYRIQTGTYQNVLEHAYMDYIPEQLNLSAMKKGMKLLTGNVDFKSLNSNPRLKKSTLRTVDKLQMKVDSEEIKIYCQIDQVWPGLIPAIYGVLIQLGKQKLKLEELIEGLKEGQLGSLYMPAPTKAIMLKQVLYL